MSLRAKLLLVIVGLALVPMLASCTFFYLSAAGAVEKVLREVSASDAARAARHVEESVRAQEQDLLNLADSPAVRAHVAKPGAGGEPSEDLRAVVTTFYKSHDERFNSLTCLRAGGQPSFRVSGGGEPRLQTADFVMSSVRYDDRVWSAGGADALRSRVALEPHGSVLRSTVPVFEEGGGRRVLGALVAEMSVEALLAEAGGYDGAAQQTTGRPRAPRRVAVALENSTGRIVHHDNGALHHQPVSSAMPFFEPVARAMMTGASGSDSFDTPDGDRWVASFVPLQGLGLSLAVAENYTAASRDIRRTVVILAALSLLACVAAAAFVALITKRATEDIWRVAAGAAAIARGDLAHRIEISTSGETRDLAERFNLMGDRLRDVIAREAETKQFESFLRLSAMLTHDLKNAITSLSMLVDNMEKKFHREEFRADAVTSLREATDKLRRLVARQNEPVASLSGEFRRGAQETDLVPIFRRVLARTAEPSTPLYQIETRLPETLIATIEPERIENVFENLVVNALEAMGVRGGRLMVEAGREGDGRVFFSVSDTGTGMSEEFVRERLFHPFATTKTKGIGLGLYTCREVVEAHGGRIDVESKIGSGTRFRVVLPSLLFVSERQSHPAATAASSERDV